MKTKKSQSLGEEDSSASQAKETMTTHVENRKETVRPKLLLTPRQPTTMATWNVRTMYAGGKTAVIAEEMRGYNPSLLGLGLKPDGFRQGRSSWRAESPYCTPGTQMTLHHIQRE